MSKESDWKCVLVSGASNKLSYDPHSWRELWTHFKDLLKKKPGHGMSFSAWVKTKENIKVSGNTASWNRPLSLDEMDFLIKNPPMDFDEIPPNFKAECTCWWDLDGYVV